MNYAGCRHDQIFGNGKSTTESQFFSLESITQAVTQAYTKIQQINGGYFEK